MSYERIVIAVDVLARNAEVVFARADAVAGGASATALHVVEEGHLAFGDQLGIAGIADLHEAVRSESARRLGALCAASGVDRHVLRSGRAADEIRGFAKESAADLVVMGAHGRRGWQLLLGSTANAVLHGTPCDVLCAHVPGTADPLREVLVAVHDMEEAEPVLGRAAEVAATVGARVSIVSVIRPIEHSYPTLDLAAYDAAAVHIPRDAEARLSERLAELASSFDLSGERIVRHGHPAEEIRRAAEERSVGLVVLGTHGRHGFARLLGSTANGVLHGAKFDVLAVRLP